MNDQDRLAIIRDKLVAIASELRGLKVELEDNVNAATSTEYAEDAVDNAVHHIRTAMDDITYA